MQIRSASVWGIPAVRTDEVVNALAVIAAICLLSMSVQAQSSESKDRYDALWLYQGSWQLTPATHAPQAKGDQVTNECKLIGTYFACQQRVNEKLDSLIVFVPAADVGHYFVQAIDPLGKASGRSELRISGDLWTYDSKEKRGNSTTYYRTTNVFSGKDRIHFEQLESLDGQHWIRKDSGDEKRLSP